MKKNILLILPVLLLTLGACNHNDDNPLTNEDEDEVKTYESWSDFDNETFVSVTGTNCEDAVKALIKDPTFIYVDDPKDMAAYIEDGTAIAGVTNEPNIAFLAASFDDLDVYPNLLDIEDYGFLLSKNNELTEKINTAIDQITNSGDLAEIIDKWIYAESEPSIDFGEYKVDTQDSLTLAVDPSFEPCCYLDSKGNYAGYEIELAYLVASTLGYNLNIVSMDFADLFAAVSTDTVDFATCIITISEERKASYDLSDSFYTGGVALLMEKDITDPLQSEKSFASLDDFAGETIATIGGASGVVDPAKERIENLNIKYYRSTEAALDALKGGRVSGLLRNRFNLEHYLEGEDDLMLFPESVADDHYGFMLDKDSELTAKVNGALQELGSDYMSSLQTKWINASEETRIDLDEYKVENSVGTIRYAFADGNEPFSYTIDLTEEELNPEGGDNTDIGNDDSTGGTLGENGAIRLLDDDENQSVDDDSGTGSDSGNEDTRTVYLAGYEVELMYALAYKLNMDLEVTILPAFNDLFTEIDNGNADIVSGGISITEARKETYDFSDSIFTGEISIAIRVDSYASQLLEDK